jgi:Domain of unknown function (DUF6259)
MLTPISNRRRSRKSDGPGLDAKTMNTSRRETFPRFIRLFITACLFLTRALTATIYAAPSLVEQTADDVRIVRDDNSQWGGPSYGMTHQCDPRYQAKKNLDLATVPEAAWAATREIRLSAFFCVRDYSPISLGKANGLDEAFEVIVNGKVHTFPNNGGAPVYADRKPVVLAWFDFALPKEEFVRGRNEIVFRKAPTPGTKAKPDDYLYLGIDNTASAGNSAVSFDGGKTWVADKLNAVGARGEYMVRLVLLASDRGFESAWRPASKPALSDPAGVLAYAGAHGGEARLEWDAARLDPSQPVTAVVETDGKAKFKLRWLDAEGKPLPPVNGAGPRFETTLKARLTSGVMTDATVLSLAVRGVRGYHAVETPINLCPSIAAPAGTPAQRKPACRVAGDGVLLENASLRCRFSMDSRHLKLASIFNELAKAEIIRQPDKLSIFLVEIGTNHFSGAGDFECRSVQPKGRNGFTAELFLPAHALAATLTGAINTDGLRLGLTLANRGPAPLDFKVAFPHLAGLALSGDPAADDYYFPRGGGIIADRPALIRQGYGDHQALYQFMDLFSPSLGAGLSVRADDADGRYKIFALAKHLPGRVPVQTLAPMCPTKPEFQFSNTFEKVTGTSLAVEYLRRTREPGGLFAPAPVVIAAHPGDWKTPMKDYAGWAHRAWKFRPPSRLGGVVNMIAVGWGHDLLFKDGAYRTDFLKPGRDCLELMSWWDWSSLGPWSTPFDHLKEKIGEARCKQWQPYFVTDPVTGQMMWNNQPGDYDGYNARFGGLPAFRKAVENYKKSGSLITLYTDPFRLDDASKTGQKHGKEWDVIQANGEYAKAYEVWNPCHDLPEVRQWVADTMGRVMRETGADGIRLDEYGHRGWACYNPAHQHTFAEPGCTEWLRATAEATKMVRAAMDKVSRRLVLTTEHPGYDYLMQFLDGCITYDLTVQATPLRPLECNTQRFYFPECKAYELDHSHADTDCHKRFWNMVAAFGREYPPAMHAILKENNDVLGGSDCEPLVPTLKPMVYANRFGSGAKTLWTLYNATGHTVDEPLLAVDFREDQHVVDLLGGGEVSAPASKPLRVSRWLARGGVACIARLPRLIALARNGDQLSISLKSTGAQHRLVVSNDTGETLLSIPASSKTLNLDLNAARDKKPCCVKLLRDGTLLDVAAIP